MGVSPSAPTGNLGNLRFPGFFVLLILKEMVYLRAMVFDQAAQTYDQDFTDHDLARWLRARVWSRLDMLFQPGMRVLELGCGTGEDALHVAQRGIEVIATDVSAKMLRLTQSKTVGLKVTTVYLDLNDPQTWKIPDQIDGVYSNFGALNCTNRWADLAIWLADHLSLGSRIGLGVMGRFCLWETLWHGLHLDWKTAARRWSGQGMAMLADGNVFPVYYPSPTTLQKRFGPYFEPIALLGLGVFLPPSDAFGVLESRKTVKTALIKLENRLAHHAPWRCWDDHFWLELRRS